MNYRHRSKRADRSGNSAISLPPGGTDCSFSYAVFLCGTIATSRNAVNALRGLPRGSRVVPPYGPDRRGVRPLMDHGKRTAWRRTLFPGRGRVKLPLGVAGHSPWKLTPRSPRLYQAGTPSCNGARVTTIRRESAALPTNSESTTSRAAPTGRTDKRSGTSRVPTTGA